MSTKPIAYWMADERAGAWDGQIVCRECERQIAEDVTAQLPDPDADTVELESEPLADTKAVYGALRQAGWTEHEIARREVVAECERCHADLSGGPNPNRQRGDDDGVEYGDPRDEMQDRLNRD